ncbi:MAG: LSM domain-containing protein [Haloferacaceae archaeon]
MSGRPLDVLEDALDRPVTVHLKDGRAFHGTLAGYDQHMNVVLDPVGDAGPADGDGDGDGDGDAPTDPAAPDDVRAVGDTTVIRGDNLVTIET